MRRVATAALLACGCVFGWRGEAELSGAHDLAGIDTVHVELPSTPLSVVACEPGALAGCPDELRWRGRVLSTGGSDRDARRHAQQVELVFERDEGLGLLRADIPLAVRGLVELEIEAMELPADRDLELVTTRGDVEVFGTRGAVSVRTEVGDVTIDGGDAGVAVLVDDGEVVIDSAGDVEARTDRGAVTVRQSGDPRRVEIVTGTGAVRIELASATDVDLDLRADGEIHVVTDTVVALAKDRLQRRVGAGTVTISVDAGGTVDIVQRR